MGECRGDLSHKGILREEKVGLQEPISRGEGALRIVGREELNRQVECEGGGVVFGDKAGEE